MSATEVVFPGFILTVTCWLAVTSSVTAVTAYTVESPANWMLSPIFTTPVVDSVPLELSNKNKEPFWPIWAVPADPSKLDTVNV